MRPPLLAVSATQDGIFLRRQALQSYTEREFVSLTRPGGAWVRVRYGAYTERFLWSRLDDEGRRALRDRAAVLVCDDDAVLSHASAARRLGLASYDISDELTHVIRREHGRTSRTQAGVTHHQMALPLEQIVDVAGVRVTDPLRTAMDIARDYGFHAGVVTADSALHLGASKVELEARAVALTTEAHGPTMRAVAEFADAGAETPLESLGRILLASIGVTEVETQYEIWLPNGRLAVVDMYSREHDFVFECDGRIKYRDQVDASGRTRSPDDVVWDEKRREDMLRGLGHGVVRVTWADTVPENHYRAGQRVLRDMALQGRRLPGLRAIS